MADGRRQSRTFTTSPSAICHPPSAWRWLLMKSLRFTVLITLFLVLAPAAFAADFGVRAGRLDRANENFVGAEMLFDLGTINLNPNIEYWLVDDVTEGTANLDV